MQQELIQQNPGTKVRLLAVNLEGLDSFVPEESSFGSLPILQDTAAQNVWESWNATWRDVMILNPDNIHVDTYNLTSHDLANPSFYAELKAKLKAVAGEP
jgi:hypothetical protein